MIGHVFNENSVTSAVYNFTTKAINENISF
jgi:hypothetical protein